MTSRRARSPAGGQAAARRKHKTHARCRPWSVVRRMYAARLGDGGCRLPSPAHPPLVEDGEDCREHHDDHAEDGGRGVEVLHLLDARDGAPGLDQEEVAREEPSEGGNRVRCEGYPACERRGWGSLAGIVMCCAGLCSGWVRAPEVETCCVSKWGALAMVRTRRWGRRG